MKLTVLVDNNTLIDRYFLGEPGLSFFIEEGETHVLFDVGYSDIFLRNGMKMGVDFTNLDYIALSHGHLDHTWGLDPLIRFFAELSIEKRTFKRPGIIAHPQTLISVAHGRFGEFGSLISESRLSKHFVLSLSEGPQRLSERLVYLGAVPRVNGFESRLRFGRKEGASAEDTVPEDSALIYQSDRGLVIITGCSHAGICNIIDYAMAVCGDHRVAGVVGGLHLQNPPEKQLQGTVRYLKKLQLSRLHACHCTDLASKWALSEAAPVEEVGVGMVLHFD